PRCRSRCRRWVSPRAIHLTSISTDTAPAAGSQRRCWAVTEFLTWLPDILRDAGLQINVMAGAERRGSRGRGLNVHGVVWHSTVTGLNVPDHRVAALLRDGHSTLAGPLSQMGTRRSGVIDIPALGRCNHNGYGLWGNNAIGN